MTLPLESTLAEIRRSVLVRLGIVDEAIRRAHKAHYYTVEWQALRRREEFALSEGVHSYDFPDETQVGQIGALYVQDADGRRPSMLLPGTTATGRDTLRESNGTPAFYEFIDEQIDIYPAPDESYTTLVIEYQLREPSLVADEDRVILDSELITAQAVVYMRMHLALPGATEEQSLVAERIRQLKAQQASGRRVHGASYGRRTQYGKRFGGPSSPVNYLGSGTQHGRVDQRGYSRGYYL